MRFGAKPVEGVPMSCYLFALYNDKTQVCGSNPAEMIIDFCAGKQKAAGSESVSAEITPTPLKWSHQETEKRK